MITKEIFKNYMNHECEKLAWVMFHEKEDIKMLFKALDVNLDADDISDEFNIDQLDSLYEFIRMNHNDFEDLYNKLLDQKDPISRLIYEMKDLQGVANLSREWFICQYPKSIFKRADTVDGSINGEPIYNQKQIEENTKILLNDPIVDFIFEGQITFNGMVSRWDCLEKNKNGTYRLIEVKGSNSIQTEHILDVFFQYYVYINYGLNINEINILHLNNDYEGVFDPLDDSRLKQLFKLSLTYRNHIEYTILDYVLKEYNDLSKKLIQIQEIVALSQKPNTCLIYGCKKCFLLGDCHELTKDHVFNLTNDGVTGGNYRTLKKILEAGIVSIQDISGALLDEYPVIKNNKYSVARLQIEYAKGNINEKNFLQLDQIKEELKKYDSNKLVFFDFESMSYPIPYVTKMKPWEQVPTQYSMHIVDKGYDLLKHDYHSSNKTGGIKHFEFIGNPIKDQTNSPDLRLLENLINDFKTAKIDWRKGDFRMVVFNSTYEKGRFKRLKEKYPEEKYVDFINACLENMIDLRDFFVKALWVREDFNGKTGLKTIVNAIINDQDFLKQYEHVEDFHKNIDYTEGKIKNGSQALEAYQSLYRKVLTGLDTNDVHDEILNALKYYCKIDTWSNVVIYDILRRFVN